jgi:ceramide synthetase
MWWYYYYSPEELVEIGTEWKDPSAWGPGPHGNRAYQPNYDPHYEVLVPWVLFYALLFTILRPILTNWILRPLAEKRILTNGFTQDTVEKFCESGTRALFYSCSSIALIYVCWQEDFFWHPWRVWFVAMPPGPRLSVLYQVELGWYLMQTIAHTILDKKKSDFWVMTIHHGVTLLLLLSSWHTSYFRIGLIVLFCHDISDPFLEAGKMFNYLFFPYWGLFSFIGLVATWIVLRLLYYPFVVCYTALFEGVYIVGSDITGYLFFNSLLGSLVPLHIYWFTLILKVGLRVGGNLFNAEGMRGIDVDERELPESSDHAAAKSKHPHHRTGKPAHKTD